MKPPPINNFKQVDVVKLLGILLSNNLVFFVLMHNYVMYFKCAVSRSITW